MLKPRAKFILSVIALLGLAVCGSASPVVTSSTIFNIDGSGYDAIDFYYAASQDAEFTNYRLNFETTNGALIYDPIAAQFQNSGSGAVDTFMNTVGSHLGIGDASQIRNAYNPVGLNADAGPISRIDWSVFDTLGGDSNSVAGYDPGPYHLARVLVSPNAVWNAKFDAFDTLSRGNASVFQFTNDPTPVVVPPPVIPDPPSVINEPVVPPVVAPELPPAPTPTPVYEPPTPPLVSDPPPAAGENPSSPDETIIGEPIVWVPRPLIMIDWLDGELSDPVIRQPSFVYWFNTLQPGFAIDYSLGAIDPVMIDVDGAWKDFSTARLTNFAAHDGSNMVFARASSSISDFAPAGNSQFSDASAAPEPATLSLLALALGSFLAVRRR